MARKGLSTKVLDYFRLCTSDDFSVGKLLK